MLATAGTAAADMDLCLTPYVGVDAQIRHMPFQKDFGGNVLKKNYPQGNFFAGLKFNDYVGIEAGYEVSKKKSATKTHNNSDVIFGNRVIQEDPFTTVTSIKSDASSKIHGWNLNLVGFLPILCDDNSLQLIGSVGLAQLKLKSKNLVTFSTSSEDLDPSSGNVIFTPNTTTTLSSYQKRKVVLRIGTGVQHMITDCIGIRGLVTWENTSKLNAKPKSSNGAPTILPASEKAKTKNSFQYGLGIFTVF